MISKRRAPGSISLYEEYYACFQLPGFSPVSSMALYAWHLRMFLVRFRDA